MASARRMGYMIGKYQGMLARQQQQRQDEERDYRRGVAKQQFDRDEERYQANVDRQAEDRQYARKRDEMADSLRADATAYARKRDTAQDQINADIRAENKKFRDAGMMFEKQRYADAMAQNKLNNELKQKEQERKIAADLTRDVMNQRRENTKLEMEQRAAKNKEGAERRKNNLSIFDEDGVIGNIASAYGYDGLDENAVSRIKTQAKLAITNGDNRKPDEIVGEILRNSPDFRDMSKQASVMDEVKNQIKNPGERTWYGAKKSYSNDSKAVLAGIKNLSVDPGEAMRVLENGGFGMYNKLVNSGLQPDNALTATILTHVVDNAPEDMQQIFQNKMVQQMFASNLRQYPTIREAVAATVKEYQNKTSVASQQQNPQQENNNVPNNWMMNPIPMNGGM